MNFEKLKRPCVKPAANHSTILQSSDEESFLPSLEQAEIKIDSKMSAEFSITPDQYSNMTLYEKVDYLEKLNNEPPADSNTFFGFETATLEDIKYTQNEMKQADPKLRVYYQRKILEQLNVAVNQMN